jgi:hypothetical protein
MSDASRAARAFVDEANVLIANQDFDRATAKLELADVELEDLAGDDRSAVAALIATAQGSIASARAAQHKPRYLRTIRNLMDDAESNIGNLVTWPGTERQLKELFADETAKLVIPDELAEAEPKFNTFRKLHSRKAAAEMVQQVEREVESAETQWQETKQNFEQNESAPSSDDYAIQRTNRYIEDARKRLAALPVDSDATRQLTVRLNTVAAEVMALTATAQISEMVDYLNRRLELYEYEFGGWEDEPEEGPTWAEYAQQSGQRMSAFFAPHTIAYRERVSDILESLEDNEDYQAVRDAGPVRTVVDDARTNLERANTSLLARVRKVVNDALVAPINDTNPFDRLESDIRLALGESSPHTVEMMAQVQQKLRAHESGVEEAHAASANQLDMLYARAEEVWPSLYAGLSWADEIDLDNVGQQIGFLADNLMGYRFKPGHVYYATTIHGQPVAAKIDAGMMAGIAAIEAAIGRTLGDDDRDGKWDVVAVVTDKRTKLMAKRLAESSGNIGGIDVQISTDYAEPVDAVVIDFLAAKCGPFAGSKERGVLRPDGSVGP